MRDQGILAVLGSGLALICSSGAAAQGAMEMPVHDCAAQSAVLSPEFASWATRAPVTAAKDKAGLGKAMLVIGKAVDAALPPTSEVRYVLRPEKRGRSVSFGGIFAFDVKEAGTYRVALGSAAWIDLLEDGKSIASTGHGHGPDCSGIRKMVAFPLKPGRHVLQLSANPVATAAMMVMRLP